MAVYKQALDLAVEATKAAKFKDWWWKIALGKCYMMVGLTRDAEQQMKSALKQNPSIEIFLRLANLYCRLDQPLNALDICTGALQIHHNEVTLLTEIARFLVCFFMWTFKFKKMMKHSTFFKNRVLEGLNNIPASVKYYREILQEDATNVEAIACIAVNYFYSDQPEVALRYYR